jgi:hypothetical protein
LQQDLKYKKHHEWIFTFIPRYRISHQEYGVENGWGKTTLHLDPDQGRENIVLLSAPQDAPAWQSLWEEAGLKQPA